MSDLNASRRPILVTGAHRSGTTWVGEMMSVARAIHYVHEPFNVTDPPGPGICAVRFRHWFTYVCPENEQPYLAPIRKTVTLRYDYLAAAKAIRTRAAFRQTARQIREYRRIAPETRAIVKDPIAFFSAPWLASRFAMHVVVMIRHPAAFASSIMQLGWTHPFAHFLEQPLLMRDVLSPFEREIRTFAASERPIIDQAILLWRMIYATVLVLRERHHDWTFSRHEDLSREPSVRFRELFARVELPIVPQFDARIEELCGPDNPVDPTQRIGSAYALRRDSARNIDNWKRRLTADEITRIRMGTADVAPHFYTDADW